jgi:hypothetical protein
LNQAVSQGRFAVVNVRNDGKISDVVHQRKASNKGIKNGTHKKKGRVEWRRALNQQSLATAMVGASL